MGAPIELVAKVPLFNGMPKRDLERLAQTFKEMTYSAGDTIASEGQGAVGFFVIGDGNVTYSVKGQQTGTGGPGGYFGEIALIDDGPRSATVTAATDVTAYGLTSWDFRPVVEENASVAWQLLQALAKRLREAQRAAAS